MKPRRNLILIGMKSSGKTTIGKILARELGLAFTDMDAEVERRHFEEKGEWLRFRDIFKNHGKDYFRNLETAALQTIPAGQDAAPLVLATGGGLPLAEENRPLLKELGVVVFLDVAPEELLERIVRRGIPPFFPYPDDPARSLAELLAVRRPIYGALADLTVTCRSESPEDIANTIIHQIENPPHED